MAPPDDNDDVIKNEAELTVGAVTTKLKDDPLAKDVNVARPPPLGPYVGAAKSELTENAAPTASDTLMVHEISSLTRTNVVAKLVCPMHDSLEAVVADETLKLNELPVIAADPTLTLSVTKNVDAIVGAVKKKVNVTPALAVDSVLTPDPLGPYVGTVKSAATPLVAPAAFRAQ